MGRAPCCAKIGLKKGRWTSEEDEILTKYIQTHGEGSWRDLPKNAGLLRCGKSCRLRWMNYLRLDLRRGNISAEEEELIIKLHGLLGNRWSLIAGRMPGRTDNEIKNYWNSHLSRKLGDRGIDPVTHKPFHWNFSLQTRKHAKSEQSSTIKTSKELADDKKKSLETEKPMKDKSVVITGTYKRKKAHHDKGAPKKKKAVMEKLSSRIGSQSPCESCSEINPNESKLKMQSQDCNFSIEEEAEHVKDEHPTSSLTVNLFNLWEETFSSNILPSEMGLFGSFDTDSLLMFDNQLPDSNAAYDNSYNTEDTTDDLWSFVLSNMESSCYP